MVADLTDKGRLRKEAFKNMHLVSASECRILYYSKSCDNSVSDSIKEFVKDQSWVNGTIFSDSLEFPDGMELYRTLLIGDQNERRVRFVKQNTEATTKVIVKPFFPGRNLSSSNIAKNQMDLLQSMAGDYFDFVILKNELPDDILQTLRTYGSKAPLQLLASCNALPLMMEPCPQNHSNQTTLARHASPTSGVRQQLNGRRIRSLVLPKMAIQMTVGLLTKKMD